MTEDEKYALRGRLVADYLKAVDEEKAMCGQMGEFTAQVLMIGNALNSDPGQLLSRHRTNPEAIQFPTLEAILNAAEKCVEARGRTEAVRQRALDGGVPPQLV